jgi:hypothetical protein
VTSGGARAALTVLSGQCGSVSRVEDIFALGGILACGSYARVGRRTAFAGIATRHCGRTAIGARRSIGGSAVVCGE